MYRYLFLIVFATSLAFTEDLGTKNYSREYIIDQRFSVDLEYMGKTQVKVFKYKTSLGIDNIVVHINSSKRGEEFLAIASFGKLLRINGLRFDDLNGDKVKDLIIMSTFISQNEPYVSQPVFAYDAYVQTENGFVNVDLAEAEILSRLTGARSIEQAVTYIQDHCSKKNILLKN